MPKLWVAAIIGYFILGLIVVGTVGAEWPQGGWPARSWPQGGWPARSWTQGVGMFTLTWEQSPQTGIPPRDEPTRTVQAEKIKLICKSRCTDGCDPDRELAKETREEVITVDPSDGWRITEDEFAKRTTEEVSSERYERYDVNR